MSSFMLGADTIDPTLEAERITLREKLKATPGTAAKADVTRYYTLYGMLYEKLSGEALAAYVTEKVTAYFSGITASGQVITYGTLPESKTVSSHPVSATPVSAGGTIESLLPAGAAIGSATPQSVQAYRVLTQNTKMCKIGSMGLFIGGKDFYAEKAVSFMATSPDFIRTTKYDNSYIEFKGFATGPLSLWIEYWAHKIGFDYKPVDRYFASLESEYNIPNFLSLLKLHRSAGVETDGPCYSLFQNYDKSPFGYLLKDKKINTFNSSNYQPQPVRHQVPYMPLTDKSPTDDMNIRRKSAAWSTGNILMAAIHDPSQYDVAKIAKFSVIPYVDFEYRYENFVNQVLRYRERVLAYSLFLCKKQLDTAQLEDQQTLIDLVGYFANSGQAPYNEIIKDEFIDIMTPDGRNFYQHNFPCNFGDDKIRISYTDQAGNTNPLDAKISDLLKLQYEAAVWIFIVNQDKYYGRMAQLESPDAILKSNNIPSFQMNPWENPFLVFDLQASKEAGRPIYKDTAGHLAYKPESDRIVTSDFVPEKYMEMAPLMKAKYLRSVPGAGGYSLNLPDTDNKSNSAWVLGALAAAGSLYLMNK